MTDSINKLEIESQELLWIDCCESAEKEFQFKHFKTAMDYWQEAVNLAESFTENDPRRAASLNNVGVISRFRNNLDAAEEYYQSAKLKWIAAADWVTRMDIMSRATSSIFHMRMERRHGEEYNRPVINDYQNKLEAGYAVTLNNHAELLQLRNHQQQARAQYALALDKRIKASLTEDAGVNLIQANLKASLDESNEHYPQISGAEQTIKPSAMNFMERARRAKWLIDKPPVFTDEGRLMAAILFTHIITVGTPRSC